MKNPFSRKPESIPFSDGDILYNQEGAGDFWVVEGDMVRLYFDGLMQHEEPLEKFFGTKKNIQGFKKVGQWKSKSQRKLNIERKPWLAGLDFDD